MWWFWEIVIFDTHTRPFCTTTSQFFSSLHSFNLFRLHPLHFKQRSISQCVSYELTSHFLILILCITYALLASWMHLHFCCTVHFYFIRYFVHSVHCERSSLVLGFGFSCGAFRCHLCVHTRHCEYLLRILSGLYVSPRSMSIWREQNETFLHEENTTYTQYMHTDIVNDLKPFSMNTFSSISLVCCFFLCLYLSHQSAATKRELSADSMRKIESTTNQWRTERERWNERMNERTKKRRTFSLSIIAIIIRWESMHVCTTACSEMKYK